VQRGRYGNSQESGCEEGAGEESASQESGCEEGASEEGSSQEGSASEESSKVVRFAHAACRKALARARAFCVQGYLPIAMR